ncbi:MAG: NADP-specific glutamate dehydrogenase GdhA, partial [Gemmatimonadota bacterium]
MGAPHPAARGRSLVDIAREKGLDTALLYESIIELSGEGLLTATCLDAAARILLTQLGLTQYFYNSLSKDALKRVLRAIAGNLQRRDGEFVLRGEVSEAHFDVDGGVQARIATAEHLASMEAGLNPAMAGHRVEYYYCDQHQYHTYIIRPERCKAWEELAPGASPFAFDQITAGPPFPAANRHRYESFLRRSTASVVPLIEVSRAAATRETRVVFREDFDHSILPVVRTILAEVGVTLNRAYWEIYRTPVGRIESICSLYLDGSPGRETMDRIVERLHALVAIQSGDLDDLYAGGTLTFEEYIFAIAAAALVHAFIHRESDADGDIMRGLERKELRDAMARRVFDSDRSEYTRPIIVAAIRENPELVKRLYALFERKFSPRHRRRPDLAALDGELAAFRRRAAILLADDRTGYDVCDFMTRIVSHVQKTSFYKVRKRSCAFRLDPKILDPLVYRAPVYGLFFVVGFYAVGTHMRAADVARGGLRLIRVTPGNYDNELDAMP